MGLHSEAFIGIDTAKLRSAVAVTEVGRTGELRYLGEVDTSEAATRKLVASLAGRSDVAATPDIGGLAPEAVAGQALEVAVQVGEIVAGQALRGAVNAEHWTRRRSQVHPRAMLCIVPASADNMTAPAWHSTSRDPTHDARP